MLLREAALENMRDCEIAARHAFRHPWTGGMVVDVQNVSDVISAGHFETKLRALNIEVARADLPFDLLSEVRWRYARCKREDVWTSFGVTRRAETAAGLPARRTAPERRP